MEVKYYKFISKYIKGYKKNIVLIFFLMILLTILTMIPGVLIQDIFDNGIYKKNYSHLLNKSLILLLTYSLSSVLNFHASKLFSRLSQTIVYRIKKNLVNRLLESPMEFFNFYQSGYLSSRINEVDKIGSLFSSNVFKIILSIFEFIAVLVLLLQINVKLTLILLLISPLYYFLPKRFLSRISESSIQIAEDTARLNSKMQQTIQGIEEIKNLSVEKNELNKIKDIMKKLIKLNINQATVYSFGMEIMTFLSSFSYVFLLVIGGLFIIKKEISIGSFMVFSAYTPKLYSPMQNSSTSFLSIQPAIASLKRVILIIHETERFPDNNRSILIKKINSISFENVSFSYSNKNVIENINFYLEREDKLSIKGGNGTGKTTILRLLMGLYSCTNGIIKINDVDITKINENSLRENIGVISQKIYLFNDSIENNIKYGSENTDDSTYLHVLKLTGLDKIIDNFENKDKFIIEENGKNLSGGQIQRIAIARAMLKDPNIFLFDEAVSQIDTEGRNLIENLIYKHLKNKLCVFITHNNEFDHLCNKFLCL